MRILPCLLFLAACSDYALKGREEPPGRDTDGGVDGEDTDAVVDTDGGDTDEADACGEPDLSPQSVTPDESCHEDPVVGTFTPTVLWANASVDDSFVMPIVGQLTDDDGDGAVTAADIPDVVHSSTSTGKVFALDGLDGSLHWTGGAVNVGANAPAIGDLDGDGWPEVVITGPDATVALHGDDGSVYWTAAPYSGKASMICGALGIWDLDGDGSPEVVLGREIRDGRTGAVEGEGTLGEGADGGAGPISAVADIDQDGEQEVVTGNALYDVTGATIWSNGQPDGYPAIGQFDADPYGEIVVTTMGTVRLQDDDGTVLWTRPSVTGGRSGAATIADLDGDGEPEIGVAGYNTYVVLEADGSTRWSMAVSDGSGFTGSSVFDFEGDGAAEIVFADERDVYVLDGSSGAVKLKETRHASATCSEYPVVADVDADGHADIVYASGKYGDSTAAITVLSDASRSWQAGRPVWNQYAYDITNVEDDGGIPAVRATNWLTYNNYRSGDVLAATGGLQTDAVPLLNEICALECDEGHLRVTVVVGNAGTGEIPAGLAVSAWALQSGSPVWLETQRVAAPIASGSSSSGIVFELDPADVTDGVIEIRADDDDGVQAFTECDEDNNVLVLDDGLCP